MVVSMWVAWSTQTHNVVEQTIHSENGGTYEKKKNNASEKRWKGTEMSVVKNVDERAFEMQKEERAWTVTEEQ